MLDDTERVPAAGNAPTHVDVSVNGKLHATTEGLFVPAVTLEQPVKPGDAAGKIYSVIEPERAPSTFHFVEDGIVLSVVNRGMVNKGELLVMAGNITNQD